MRVVASYELWAATRVTSVSLSERERWRDNSNLQVCVTRDERDP